MTWRDSLPDDEIVSALALAMAEARKLAAAITADRRNRLVVDHDQVQRIAGLAAVARSLVLAADELDRAQAGRRGRVEAAAAARRVTELHQVATPC